MRRDEQETLLFVGSLSRYPQPAELDLKSFNGLVPVELFGETEFPRIGELPYFLTLAPHGFYLFSLRQAAVPVTVRPQRQEVIVETTGSVPALLAGVAWDTLLDTVLRRYLEREALVPFLLRQRWFGAQARRLTAARFVDWGLLRSGSHPVFMTAVEAEFEDGAKIRYSLPLATLSGPAADAMLQEGSPAVLARITGARKGVLADAMVDESAAELLLEAIANGRRFHLQQGELRAERGADWLSDPPDTLRPVRRMGVEQSNSSVRFGDRKILKIYRRLETTQNPELELLQQLSRAGFRRVPPLAGWLEYAGPDGTVSTAGLLQGLVPHQGDAWARALDELDRYFERVIAAGTTPPPDLLTDPATGLITASLPETVKGILGVPHASAATLGRRTAEMHRALADSTDPAFAPEPLTRTDIARVAEDAAARAQEVGALLRSRRDSLDPSLHPMIDRVQQELPNLPGMLRNLARVSDGGRAIRTHGDYHLGQVLSSEEDFIILDFEGEPARPIEERRKKTSPLRDVAGMVRSFGYAVSVGAQKAIRRNPAGEPLVEAWAIIWEIWIAAVFVKAYASALGGTGILPQSTDDVARVLNLYIVEKAFYELQYELNNRPDWVRVPLGAVGRLL
ncbi:MAG TPA: putative maltokinase [Vicinamibacterales bacterium]|nr:putative maltokinase [Vicinamibacterales bacterium]